MMEEVVRQRKRVQRFNNHIGNANSADAAQTSPHMQIWMESRGRRERSRMRRGGLSCNHQTSSTVHRVRKTSKAPSSASTCLAGPSGGAVESSALRPGALEHPPPLMTEPLTLKPLH